MSNDGVDSLFIRSEPSEKPANELFGACEHCLFRVKKMVMQLFNELSIDACAVGNFIAPRGRFRRWDNRVTTFENLLNVPLKP